MTYNLLLDENPEKAAEASHQYHYFTERHLQALWLDQKYFKHLKTAAGEPIQVLSPGIWNAEAGPDFKKAHVRIGTLDLRGDIELHLTDEGWVNHGHDQDERYNQVILHISLWNPKKERVIETKSGLPIVKAYLEDYITIPLNRIVQLVDLELYPYRKFIGSGRCAQGLYRGLSEERIVQLFSLAADWRLQQKHLFLASKISTASWQLGAGISVALGYKNNSQAFLDLFLTLIPYHQLSEEQIFASALKSCGYFDERYQKQWESSSFYKHLLSLRTSQILAGSSPIALTLHHVRPLNHPVRRLAYLAKLLSDPDFDRLYWKMSSLWKERWQQCSSKKDWVHLRRELCLVLPTYPDPHWNHHYTFEPEPREEYLSLIGEDLKEEILVNAFLPLLRHELKQRECAEESKAFFQFYGTFPAAKNSKSRYLLHRFFGDTPKGSVLNRASMEQGAFQIHKDFCVHYEASCEGCPFVERHRAVFGA